MLRIVYFLNQRCVSYYEGRKNFIMTVLLSNGGVYTAWFSLKSDDSLDFSYWDVDAYLRGKYLGQFNQKDEKDIQTLKERNK